MANLMKEQCRVVLFIYVTDIYYVDCISGTLCLLWFRV